MSDRKRIKIGRYRGNLWRARLDDGSVAGIFNDLAPFIPKPIEPIIASAYWRYWGYSVKLGENAFLEGLIATSGPLAFCSAHIGYDNDSEIVSSVLLSGPHVLVPGYGRGRLARRIILAFKRLQER